MVSILKRVSKLLIILVFLNIISCSINAERDNPLDPNSNKYNSSGIVTGHVYTYYAPYKPLPSATVTLNPGLHTKITDQNGAFSFTEIEPGNYILCASANNYAADSIEIIVNASETKQAQFNLDGLPAVENLSLTVGVEYDWWPTPIKRMMICDIKISDPDGYADILTTELFIPDFNFRDTLQITQTMGSYYTLLTESELPSDYLHELFGYPIYFVVSDKVEQQCTFGPQYLIRLIETEPELDSPIGVQVDSKPLLKWNSTDLPYAFTYQIDIYRLLGHSIYSKYISISNIASSTTEYQIQSNLLNGSYYWTLSIFDEFGNWSRSVRATFEIGS